MKREIYVYETSPMDIFSGLMTVEEAVRKMATGEQGVDVVSHEIGRLLEFAMMAVRICCRAENSHWEGVINELHVFALPDESCASFGIVWKQNNNGTTFICSPYPLPWVADVGDLLVEKRS